MRIPKDIQRWIAIGGLWVLVGAGCWLMAVQAFLAVLTPFGKWQKPAVAHVTVLRIERDPDDHFTDEVVVLQGGKPRTLRMLKKERADFAVDDDIWILDNYYAFGSRPSQFRLTPLRVALEYPEPLIALALWLIGRLRRAQQRDAEAERSDPHRKRTVYRDDFHIRALRHGTRTGPQPGGEPLPEEESLPEGPSRGA